MIGNLVMQEPKDIDELIAVIASTISESMTITWTVKGDVLYVSVLDNEGDRLGRCVLKFEKWLVLPAWVYSDGDLHEQKFKSSWYCRSAWVADTVELRDKILVKLATEFDGYLDDIRMYYADGNTGIGCSLLGESYPAGASFIKLVPGSSVFGVCKILDRMWKCRQSKRLISLVFSEHLECERGLGFSSDERGSVVVKDGAITLPKDGEVLTWMELFRRLGHPVQISNIEQHAQALQEWKVSKAQRTSAFEGGM